MKRFGLVASAEARALRSFAPVSLVQVQRHDAPKGGVPLSFLVTGICSETQARDAAKKNKTVTNDKSGKVSVRSFEVKLDPDRSRAAAENLDPWMVVFLGASENDTPATPDTAPRQPLSTLPPR